MENLCNQTNMHFIKLSKFNLYIKNIYIDVK